MRVIITAKEDILAKDGREFVKFWCLDLDTGHTVEEFTTKEKFEGWGITSSAYLTKDMLSEIEGVSKPVEISYTKEGRIGSVK